MPSQVIGRVQPVNQGNYDATRAYVVLDRVKHQGAWYECQADAAAGAAPEAGGNAWWLEIGGRGADGLTPTPVWNGSELHFAYSDGTTTSAVDLQGPQGVQGEQGVPGQTPPLTSGLTSTAPDVALSALGGKTLKDLVDAAQTAADAAQATADDKATAAQAAHAAMPSEQYVNLTLPAHGQSVTAIEDGYIYLRATTSVSTYTFLGLTNETNNLADTTGSVSIKQALSCSIPVSKGDTIRVSYSTSGLTQFVFCLIYLNGSAPTN